MLITVLEQGRELQTFKQWTALLDYINNLRGGVTKKNEKILDNVPIRVDPRAAFSLGTWEPGSHEMFKLKRNFW